MLKRMQKPPIKVTELETFWVTEGLAERTKWLKQCYTGQLTLKSCAYTCVTQSEELKVYFQEAVVLVLRLT